MTGAADIKTTLTWVLKDEVSGPAKGIGSSLGGLVNPTTLAIGGIAALTAGIGSMIGSAMEAQKINAQTAAVLASTGAAAGLTAKQVSDLATRISEYSGIDDGAVQAGENLLLTFTNIQDKAGEGNDIFTQATGIMADMATAMGTDMSSQAIQLGKALNDPVAGIGALSRVGVTFTDEQKTMIQSMSDAGDMAGAQAVIMAELTKEFGGSAQAAGDTAEGGFQKLQNKIGEMGEDIGTALLPPITTLTDFMLTDVVPAVEDLIAAIGPGMTKAFDEMGRGVATILRVLQPLLDKIEEIDGAALSLGDALAVVGGIISPGGTMAGVLSQPAPTLVTVGGRAVRPGTGTSGTGGGRASGGDVDPWGTYTVGEQGPETLVMGSQGGSIIPGGGNGGAPVVIPVMIDGREVARIVDEHLYYDVQRASPVLGRS